MKVINNINELMIDTISPTQINDWERLECIYDKRDSFYGKAQVGTFTFKNGIKIKYLKSFDTIVAAFWGSQLRIYGYYSQTTGRHIREFARQNGINDKITKQDMIDTCVLSI